MTDFIYPAARRPEQVAARTARAEAVVQLMGAAFRRLKRRIAVAIARWQRARQYASEMAALLQADDRMLMDIGLTRGDVRAAMQDRWWAGGSRMANAAAVRRNDAMQTAKTRRRASLPCVPAPALAPSLPATARAIEIANFR
jgi:uncharacterized protein YjiS (DUF1127 family)